MAELRARGLVVDRARGVRAVDGLDLDVERGELLAIMGRTGAGKTTLALALAGLVEPMAGSIDGPAAGAVRLVLQRPEATFLEERVVDEVALAVRARGAAPEQAEQHARSLLAQLGLPDDVADRDPLALSGGEQRRVAIAAVLAAEARILILDEPGAGLDPRARRELHRVLARLHAAGTTIVLVTHDAAEAASLATRLVVLDSGRVAFDGDVDDALGDVGRAAALGLDTIPEVRMLHLAAMVRGVEPGPPRATAGAASAALVELLRAPPLAIPAAGGELRAGMSVTATASQAASLPPLPPLVDARVRLLACALAVAAALLAGSVLAACIVVAATAAVVASARIGRARVRLAVRPLVALAILLVALELLVGTDARTELVRGRPSEQAGLAALLRALQASGVVLATLALSAATATTDLAAAIRSVLTPLRALRVPAGSIAFVLATGLGLVPGLADELERLRLAQRARGLRPARPDAFAALRADSQLLVPLFVAAFRRAHLLADALAVRGFDPDARIRPWRRRSVPASDVALLLGGIALLAVARFA